MKEQDFINEIMKFTLNRTIRLTVLGKTNLYKPVRQSDNSWELSAIDGKTNRVYGLSCSGLADIMGILLSDYAQGITTTAKIEETYQQTYPKEAESHVRDIERE